MLLHAQIPNKRLALLPKNLSRHAVWVLKDLGTAARFIRNMVAVADGNKLLCALNVAEFLV